MLVLNVPNWFYMTFTVIKPLLNETMRQKVSRRAGLNETLVSTRVVSLILFGDA